MDLDALSRDIETVESWNAGWRRNVPWPAIRRIVAATRAVLDSEEGWRCEVHNHDAIWVAPEDNTGFCCRNGRLPSGGTDCVMVRVRLLTEEGT